MRRGRAVRGGGGAGAGGLVVRQQPHLRGGAGIAAGGPRGRHAPRAPAPRPPLNHDPRSVPPFPPLLAPPPPTHPHPPAPLPSPRSHPRRSSPPSPLQFPRSPPTLRAPTPPFLCTPHVPFLSHVPCAVPLPRRDYDGQRARTAHHAGPNRMQGTRPPSHPSHLLCHVRPAPTRPGLSVQRQRLLLSPPPPAPLAQAAARAKDNARKKCYSVLQCYKVVQEAEPMQNLSPAGWLGHGPRASGACGQGPCQGRKARRRTPLAEGRVWLRPLSRGRPTPQGAPRAWRARCRCRIRCDS